MIYLGEKRKAKRAQRKVKRKVKQQTRQATRHAKKTVRKTARKEARAVKKTARKAAKSIKKQGVKTARTIKKKSPYDLDNLFSEIPQQKFHLLKATPTEWRSLLHPKLQPKSKNKIWENIYYINGLATDKKKGDRNTTLVQMYLNDKKYQNKVTHKVRLVFNPTYGAVNDVVESIYDYQWKYSKPIINPTSLAVIALLYAGKSLNSPLGLVASSQGTLITYNAVIAFSRLEKSNATYLKNKVKMLHIGTVLPTFRYKDLKAVLRKYQAFVNPKDPVATSIGKRILPSKLHSGVATAVALPATIRRLIISTVRGRSFKYHSVGYYLGNDMELKHKHEGAFVKNEHDFFMT